MRQLDFNRLISIYKEAKLPNEGHDYDVERNTMRIIKKIALFTLFAAIGGAALAAFLRRGFTLGIMILNMAV